MDVVERLLVNGRDPFVQAEAVHVIRRMRVLAKRREESLDEWVEYALKLEKDLVALNKTKKPKVWWR